LISPGNDHDITAAEALLDGSSRTPSSLPARAMTPTAFVPASGLKVPFPTFRTVPTAKRSIAGRRRFTENATATRYDKLGANFFAFIQLASIRIFLRSIESTP